ncbi:MAG TPA: hypothetical protein VM925_07640 [Labilithrix sp.]|nr:hypothetical protein [Labilithrix sp.]
MRRLGIVVLLLVGACNYGDASEPTQHHASTSKTTGSEWTDASDSERESDAGVEDPVEEVDAARPAETTLDTVWTGTLAKTGSVDFGDKDCKHRVRFDNVSVRVRLSGEKVTFATITATFVEQALNDCTTKPVPPQNRHTYTFTATTPNATAIIVPPAEANDPHAELVVDVATQSPTSGRATLRWRRADVAPPWDWMIGGQQITLARL